MGKCFGWCAYTLVVILQEVVLVRTYCWIVWFYWIGLKSMWCMSCRPEDPLTATPPKGGSTLKPKPNPTTKGGGKGTGRGKKKRWVLGLCVYFTFGYHEQCAKVSIRDARMDCVLLICKVHMIVNCLGYLLQCHLYSSIGHNLMQVLCITYLLGRDSSLVNTRPHPPRRIIRSMEARRFGHALTRLQYFSVARHCVYHGYHEYWVLAAILCQI